MYVHFSSLFSPKISMLKWHHISVCLVGKDDFCRKAVSKQDGEGLVLRVEGPPVAEPKGPF